MKYLTFPAKVLLMLFVFVLAACGGEVNLSSANIQEARLAKDEDGSSVTTKFGQEDIIYVLADLENAPDDTTVKAVFTAVNAEGESPNSQVDEYELTTGSGALTFDLAPTVFWPNGEYKVDLYLNDELDQTLTYSVAGSIIAESGGGRAMSTVEEVREAVIQIQAEGTFVEPEGVA